MGVASEQPAFIFSGRLHSPDISAAKSFKIPVLFCD